MFSIFMCYGCITITSIKVIDNDLPNRDARHPLESLFIDRWAGFISSPKAISEERDPNS
jgi:hypothetical protein